MLRQFVVVLLFGITVFADGDIKYCLTKDKRQMLVGSTWQDENHCSCTCFSIDHYTFSQCHACSPIAPTSDICIYNGWQYNEKDKWPSMERECSVCRCKGNNNTVCESAKHCSNPCHEGQIPIFGPCCQVVNCRGKATITQETMDCNVDGAVLLHGKSTVKRFHCVDKLCSCNNGEVQCFEYCQLSTNNSHQFWHPLCCPRRIGNKSCSTSINTVIDPGQMLELPERNLTCRCLDGEMYCKASNASKVIRVSYTATVSTNYITMTITSTNISKHRGYFDKSMTKTLVLIFVAILVLLTLAGIFFIVRARYLRHHKQRQFRYCLSRSQKSDWKEFDKINEFKQIYHI